MDESGGALPNHLPLFLPKAMLSMPSAGVSITPGICYQILDFCHSRGWATKAIETMQVRKMPSIDVTQSAYRFPSCSMGHLSYPCTAMAETLVFDPLGRVCGPVA